MFPHNVPFVEETTIIPSMIPTIGSRLVANVWKIPYGRAHLGPSHGRGHVLGSYVSR